MDIKVKLNVAGELRTHLCSPILPSHTICGDQYEEDDDWSDIIVIGVVSDGAKVTCAECNEVIKFCKEF